MWWGPSDIQIPFYFNIRDKVCPIIYTCIYILDVIITCIFQVPTIGVIGSGGGFRAMVGLSGVVKALADSGVLQCSAYLGGLSGSSW